MYNTPNERQPLAKSEKRLFMLFVSSQQFSSSLVRSLLTYWESNPIFPLVKHSPNLYAVADLITSDYQPIVYHWRLPDNQIEPITLAIIPQADSTYLLCWDLGSSDVAEYLIGSESTPSTVARLSKMLRAGLYLTGSRVAAITYEPSPNQNIQLQIVDEIHFALSSLPVMLSSRFALSPAVTCIGHEDRNLFCTDDRPVFTPQPLPVESLDPEPSYSIWVDDLENYYRLPEEMVLPSGDKSLRNCLSALNKQLDSGELEQYAITQEAASGYLEIDIEQSIESATALINDWLRQAGANNSDTTKLPFADLSASDWTKIVGDCLGVSQLQIQQNPQLVEARVKQLLSSLQTLVTGEGSDLDEARRSISQTAVRIQNVLRSYGLELGESIEQLTQSQDLVARLSENEQFQRLRTFLSSLNLANESETIIAEIVALDRELWSDEQDNSRHSNEQQLPLKSAKDIVREVESQHPLPTFNFDDLLQQDDRYK